MSLPFMSLAAFAFILAMVLVARVSPSDLSGADR